VGTAITPQLVDIVDTFTAERNYSSGSSVRLTFCQVEPWGLRMESPTPDDPFVDSEVTWLIPDAGVRLTHRRPRSRHARSGPTTVTAVRIQRDTRSWRTTDLLLGLSVPGRTTARIVGAEEFAAAVAGRVLRPDDADMALRTVHRALEELSMCYHDIAPWLSYRRITTPWPPI
jgi:predicted RNA-binding protein associated with RNAse of E/G family